MFHEERKKSLVKKFNISLITKYPLTQEMQRREVELTLEGETFTGILTNTSITEEKPKNYHQSFTAEFRL